MKIKNIIKIILRGEVNINKLKRNGLQIGKNYNIQWGCSIDPSHCWLIKIGDNVTLAPKVQIIAHDASTKKITGYTKIGKIEIGNNVFIGANSIILMNTKIGSNVIIGAGSVVCKNIPSNTVCVGNPAKVIYDIEEYKKKINILMETRPVWDKKWTLSGGITYEMKEKMKKELENGIGFVE